MNKNEAEHIKAIMDSHNIVCNIYPIYQYVPSGKKIIAGYTVTIDNVVCKSIMTAKQAIHSLNAVCKLGIKL